MATVSIFVLAACTSKTASDDVTFTSASGYLCSKDGASIQTEEPGTSPSRANDERIEPFTPTDSSTWGDLHCHFDPEGFEALPEDIQNQLDDFLLKEGDNPLAETNSGDRTIVSTNGYLYNKD